jgi:hypothetical protein
VYHPLSVFSFPQATLTTTEKIPDIESEKNRKQFRFELAPKEEQNCPVIEMVLDQLPPLTAKHSKSIVFPESSKIKWKDKSDKTGSRTLTTCDFYINAVIYAERVLKLAHIDSTTTFIGVSSSYYDSETDEHLFSIDYFRRDVDCKTALVYDVNTKDFTHRVSLLDFIFTFPQIETRKKHVDSEQEKRDKKSESCRTLQQIENELKELVEKSYK